MRFVYQIRLIGLLLGLCACAGRLGHPAGLPENRAEVHLYLLIGQSNMAGRGAIAAEDTLTHARVWMLNQANQWVPAKAPLHFDKPAVVGVGPGLAFGKEMAAAAPQATIGLIPCAVGGSPVAAWQPGAYYEPTRSYPYDDALRRAREAAKRGTLKGILWHQGESDSRPESIGTYLTNLEALIGRLRQDLG
ncbi:MAG: sialate O-acetylesterase, partial [Cytophagales bacterium]|nr:sialate O-acetylesterase [Cytophagales bacterium]